MSTTTVLGVDTLRDRILALPGPILVLGASGFIGANLLLTLAKYREDMAGTASQTPSWRLRGLSTALVRQTNVLDDGELEQLLDDVRPRTIFDCIAYGGYSFETEASRIYETNFLFLTRLLPRLVERKPVSYIHAGSSSEYGTNSAGPSEESFTAPNSDYAVSKVAAANLIYFYGKHRRLRCANLRLYSVYGPFEDSSRLIPQIVIHGSNGTLPEFVNPSVARDFLYIDDAVASFVDAARYLNEPDWGESFNVGTGQETTIRMVADTAQQLFGIAAQPSFSMSGRRWDLCHWVAACGRARTALNWTSTIPFPQGLKLTRQWYDTLDAKDDYVQRSKIHARKAVER